MNWIHKLVVWVLPLFPKSIVWLFSKKYIAGKYLSDGVRKTKELNGMDCITTIDVLGEEIFTSEEANQSKEECIQVLDAIQENQLKANLSLKLTSLGLRVDKELCYENVKAIVQKAKELKNFVRIDMEDSTCTDDTLEIYRKLRKDYDNVGTVIQSYLRRSREDVQQLIDDSIANLRICKGIYNEPQKVAFKDKSEIRNCFIDLVEMMLKSKSYVAIATHDRILVDESYRVIKSNNGAKSTLEFQMLLGVTEKMRNEIVAHGDRMRIYVPYGVSWHGYCIRRLKENPRLAGHIIKNLFIRG